MSTYQQLLRTLVCPFIAHCDLIHVTEREFARCFYVTLQVHRADHSKVIGAGGRMVKALTALVVAAGKRQKQQVHFEVLEPTHGEREPEPPFSALCAWTREDDIKFTNKIRPIVEAVLGPVGLMVESDGRSTIVGFVEPVEPMLAGAFGTICRAVGKSLGREVLLNTKEKV